MSCRPAASTWPSGGRSATCVSRTCSSSFPCCPCSPKGRCLLPKARSMKKLTAPQFRWIYDERSSIGREIAQLPTSESQRGRVSASSMPPTPVAASVPSPSFPTSATHSVAASVSAPELSSVLLVRPYRQRLKTSPYSSSLVVSSDAAPSSWARPVPP